MLLGIILFCIGFVIGQIFLAIRQYPALELAIVTVLADVGELEGRALHHYLRQKGFRLSRVRFYSIMAQLENAELVEGWYKTEVIDDVECKIRWYGLRQAGGRRIEEHQLARAFGSLLPSPV